MLASSWSLHSLLGLTQAVIGLQGLLLVHGHLVVAPFRLLVGVLLGTQVTNTAFIIEHTDMN